MPTTTDFLSYTQWAGIATLAFGALALAGFAFKWGIRFRIVGITGFMLVLTGGLFSLSLVPFAHTVIPGAVRFSLVYDNGGNQTVIAVAPEITQPELEATLRQAAGDLYSYGRLGGPSNQMTIRVRTITHPSVGVSKPLLLGQVKRSLAKRDDENIAIEIYSEHFAELPQPSV